MIERAWARSLAMIMTVPISPGPRYGRQSLKQARNTAITAKTNDLPPRRPTTSQHSFSGLVGAVVRPVEQELIVRQRQPEQRGQEDAPSVPRPFFSEARASGRASAAEVHHCCLRGSELPGSQARAALRVAPLMEQLTCSALRTNSAILAPVSIRNQKTCFGSCNIVTEA